MKILLLGEYSNLHWTLAQGLRILGHEVCVVSGGDFWKNYPSDISIIRDKYNKWGGVKYAAKIMANLSRFTGYDIVQLINPCFFELKADKNRMLYKFLRKYNKKVFLGAFGNDHYWVKTCTQTNTFRYSDFFVNGKVRDTDYTRKEIKDWINCEKEDVNRYIAEDCDGIIACLYEYWASYAPEFPDKTTFIPLPINRELILERELQIPEKANFFIGIQRERSHVKGTEIMEKALDRVAARYPHQCSVRKAVSVPFAQYQRMVEESDIMLDQIYSYTPAMNALLGMAKGMIAVSGGEPENYEILGETHLRPIVNVLPDEEDIYRQLEKLILQPRLIPELQSQSIKYIRKHHDYIKVAAQYIDFWSKDSSRTTGDKKI
ncbi:MAG: glycosyltransferase family 1 protein [Bacteroidales bacterium]